MTREVESSRFRGNSETSQDSQRTMSQYEQTSVTNQTNRASTLGTGTVRSNSPTVSYSSTTMATGTPYDTVSLATTTNTGFTQLSRSQGASANSIPVIAPPSFQTEQRPVYVDVASAHRNYQQLGTETEISPSSGSTVSSSDESSSSAATASFQQQKHHDNNFNLPRNNPNPAVHILNNQQQAQFPPNMSLPSIADQYFDSDESRDLMLHIDYGAIEAYNAAFQSADNFMSGAMPSNGAQFDIAKAIFNQVDTNRDGSISREEFLQWAQTNQQSYGGQAMSQSYANSHQTMTTSNIAQNSTGGASVSSNISSILQQSGLGQAITNLR